MTAYTATGLQDIYTRMLVGKVNKFPNIDTSLVDRFLKTSPNVGQIRSVTANMRVLHLRSFQAVVVLLHY